MTATLKDRAVIVAHTFTNEQARPPVIASALLSSIEAALKRLADKHWAQVEAKMIQQGFAPASGGVLVLPSADEPNTPGHRPAWVRFSPSATQASLINPRRTGLAG